MTSTPRRSFIKGLFSVAGLSIVGPFYHLDLAPKLISMSTSHTLTDPGHSHKLGSIDLKEAEQTISKSSYFAVGTNPYDTYLALYGYPKQSFDINNPLTYKDFELYKKESLGL